MPPHQAAAVGFGGNGAEASSLRPPFWAPSGAARKGVFQGLRAAGAITLKKESALFLRNGRSVCQLSDLASMTNIHGSFVRHPQTNSPFGDMKLSSQLALTNTLKEQQRGKSVALVTHYHPFLFSFLNTFTVSSVYSMSTRKKGKSSRCARGLRVHSLTTTPVA